MEVTESFVDYIKTKPIVFEVFGHYQQHPLHLQGQDLNRSEEIGKVFVVAVLGFSSLLPGKELMGDAEELSLLFCS